MFEEMNHFIVGPHMLMPVSNDVWHFRMHTIAGNVNKQQQATQQSTLWIKMTAIFPQLFYPLHIKQ